MAVECQQVGGLQAVVPGKSPLTVARPMSPMWRTRAHVDTWTPATAEMACLEGGLAIRGHAERRVLSRHRVWCC